MGGFVGMFMEKMGAFRRSERVKVESQGKAKVCQLYHYLCNFSLVWDICRDDVWLDLPAISVLIMPTKHRTVKPRGMEQEQKNFTNAFVEIKHCTCRHLTSPVVIAIVTVCQLAEFVIFVINWFNYLTSTCLHTDCTQLETIECIY